MHYKLLNFFFIILLFSCVKQPLQKENFPAQPNTFFLNKGFALVYNEDLFTDNLINGKIENRSLVIFQKNLKKDTPVKITNLINSKNLIAKVGKKTNYPSFYNSVISKRISDELEIDQNEPYIEIKEILENTSSFIAKKAKTFDEEKNVADKAPVEDIVIKNLGSKKKEKKKKKKTEFNYTIKIADFYFKKSANEMKLKILENTSINNIGINKLSTTKFRVYIGPFKTLDSLKKAYKNINQLNFENIELIKQ